ncbi:MULTISPECIES: hydroxyisourate hydrolase [unclassified Microbulbifer]|uniref:hydroxyisourate hydrolase n=1 Tax=unclassified Microbulbifer TaxID=2619833 RepID=UPI0027E4E404|nr:MULTISPECIES: hydroxyisourate hydrolase [unclassified Microbulbifer]
MQRSPITTHILDLHRGEPAAGIAVDLHREGELLTSARSDGDGRIDQWDSPLVLDPGRWTLVFHLEAWFAEQQRDCLFPQVSLAFRVGDCGGRYHLPLLLNQYGYTAYRGS